MGGNPTQTQQQSGQTVSAPWAPTGAPLRQVIGQIQGQLGNTAPTAAENNAFGILGGQYAAGDPYAGSLGDVANTFLSGGTDRTGAAQAAYDQYARQVMPWANGAMGDPSQNPALAAMLAQIQNDVGNSVNGQFAAAGRDMSGANSMALARGLAQGEAPALLQAQQMGLGAAQNLYSAGAQNAGILSNLDQLRYGLMGQGAGAAQNALAANQWGPQGILANAAAQRALPLSNIANINSLLVPIAGLGGQSTSNGQSVSQTEIPAWQQAVGATAALAGAYGNVMGGKK